MGKRLNNDLIIENFRNKYGDLYDYSLVDYENTKSKLKIICKKHGVFEQLYNQHLNTQGCPKCTNERTSNILRNKKSDIIKIFKNVHGNKYDYSLVNYINFNDKVKIICHEHGVFEQSSKSHINKNGCPKCYYQKLSKTLSDNKDSFIEKSKITHADKYDYSLVSYINSHTKIQIICKKHGKFNQLPYVHIQGFGCPKCRESKGERIIRQYLKYNNIKYTTQKSFDGCRYKLPLKFDFYLPDYNITIEYDGIHHFEINENWGGKKEFVKIKKRDKIKNKYCKENNIHLLRIKYNENIYEKLNQLFSHYEK